MKIGRGLSRILLSVILVGLTLQHSASLLAQNDQMSQLEKAKRKFNKIAKCALTKDGCTDQEALQLRVLLGTIAGLILAITGIGLGVYFSRRGGKQPPVTQKKPMFIPGQYAVVAPKVLEEHPEYFTRYIPQPVKAKVEEVKKWWQRK